MENRCRFGPAIRQPSPIAASLVAVYHIAVASKSDVPASREKSASRQRPARKTVRRHLASMARLEGGFMNCPDEEEEELRLQINHVLFDLGLKNVLPMTRQPPEYLPSLQLPDRGAGPGSCPNKVSQIIILSQKNDTLTPRCQNCLILLYYPEAKHQPVCRSDNATA